MSEDTDSIVVDTTRRIFSDLGDPQTVNSAKDKEWAIPLWQALEEAGLTRAWVPEAAGGTGASIMDAFDVARISGQYATPVAIGETLLAGWAIAAAGQKVGAGVLTIAPVRDDAQQLVIDDQDRVTGQAKSVPFVRSARQVILIADRSGTPVIASVNPADCDLKDRATDMGGERADISFNAVETSFAAPLPNPTDALQIRMLGAALRTAQMAGALETMLELSTRYATEREAFGRKISKFQAIQHNLAMLGEEVAAALTACGSVAETFENSQDDADALFLEVAAAKIRVGEAVEKGAAIAHQVHGAIGFTSEHILQRYSRRAWGWRDDFGAESVWASQLGDRVIEQGADALWPLLTTR